MALCPTPMAKYEQVLGGHFPVELEHPICPEAMVLMDRWEERVEDIIKAPIKDTVEWKRMQITVVVEEQVVGMVVTGVDVVAEGGGSLIEVVVRDVEEEVTGVVVVVVVPDFRVGITNSIITSIRHSKIHLAVVMWQVTQLLKESKVVLFNKSSRRISRYRWLCICLCLGSCVGRSWRERIC